MREKKPGFFENLWGGKKEKEGGKEVEPLNQESIPTPVRDEYLELRNLKLRKEYSKLKKDVGYDGELEITYGVREKGSKGEIKQRNNFKSIENGHTVEGSYVVFWADRFADEGIILRGENTSSLTIDGKSCEPDVAELYVDKMRPIFENSWKYDAYDKNVAHEREIEEKKKLAQAKLDIMLSESLEL